MKALKFILSIIFLSIITNLRTYEYTCGKINLKNVCAILTLRKDDYGLLVTLDQDACDYDNEHCVIDNLTTKNPGYCGNKNDYINDFYLGEECISDSNCRFGKGIKACVNGICRTSSKPKESQKHEDCFKGQYCNSETKKCEDQLLIGSKCKSQFECINTAGCIGGFCKKYFSLEPSTLFKACNKVEANVACNSGTAYLKANTEDLYVCAKFEYRERNSVYGKKIIGPSPQCEEGGYCLKFFGQGSEVVACKDSFSKNGKSFCPDVNVIGSQTNWYKLTQDYVNHCHTLNRFDALKKFQIMGLY